MTSSRTSNAVETSTNSSGELVTVSNRRRWASADVTRAMLGRVETSLDATMERIAGSRNAMHQRCSRQTEEIHRQNSMTIKLKVRTHIFPILRRWRARREKVIMHARCCLANESAVVHPAELCTPRGNHWDERCAPVGHSYFLGQIGSSC